MVRKILAYGHTLLRQKCRDVEPEYPQLERLIGDMWETMRRANGCGLAAPQIGEPLKLFVIDSRSTYEQMDPDDHREYFDPDDRGIEQTFINARIVDRSDEVWEDEEGCLSIPGLSQPVKRSWSVTVEYLDTDLRKRIGTFRGTTARMIQHEYDHTEGILYPDYLSPLRKKLLAAKLKKILKGQIEVSYPMKFV